MDRGARVLPSTTGSLHLLKIQEDFQVDGFLSAHGPTRAPPKNMTFAIHLGMAKVMRWQRSSMLYMDFHLHTLTSVGRLARAKVCSIDGIIIVVKSRMTGVLTSQSAPSQHEHHTFSTSCFIQGSMYNDLHFMFYSRFYVQ